VEPQRRMVVIVRWLNSAHADALFGRILRAVDAVPLTLPSPRGGEG
jgi:hypothetical protein